MSDVDWDDIKKTGRPLGEPAEAATEVKRDRIPRFSDSLAAGFSMYSRGAPKNPVRTGFPEIDAGLRRMGPKEVTFLAADSGVGKSTIATQAALHAAMRGHGVAYFNLEMSEEMYAIRTVANFTKVPVTRAAAGELDPGEHDDLVAGFETLRRGPGNRILMGNGSQHRSIPAIKDHVAKIAKTCEAEGSPLSLVVIDHVLQVMVSVKNDKDAEGKQRADLLKEIAEMFGVHVIGVVHVTRDASKGGKMPTKNDLASSAWFDRHADNIAILHQKRGPDGTFIKDEPALLSVQKARWGQPFSVKLKYVGGFFYPWTLETR